MNWEKIKVNHYFSRPVEYIYASAIFDLKEYDKLYENQNNLLHHMWQEFRSKYKLRLDQAIFHDDLQQINLDKHIICLWFFKESTDRSVGKDIILAGKKIVYAPNIFFITKSKDIKILEKKEYIRRPFLQLDLKNETWEQLLKRFNKRT